MEGTLTITHSKRTLINSENFTRVDLVSSKINYETIDEVLEKFRSEVNTFIDSMKEQYLNNQIIPTNTDIKLTI
jgi:hypothetical protein